MPLTLYKQGGVPELCSVDWGRAWRSVRHPSKKVWRRDIFGRWGLSKRAGAESLQQLVRNPFSPLKKFIRLKIHGYHVLCVGQKIRQIDILIVFLRTLLFLHRPLVVTIMAPLKPFKTCTGNVFPKQPLLLYSRCVLDLGVMGLNQFDKTAPNDWLSQQCWTCFCYNGPPGGFIWTVFNFSNTAKLWALRNLKDYLQVARFSTWIFLSIKQPVTQFPRRGHCVKYTFLGFLYEPLLRPSQTKLQVCGTDNVPSCFLILIFPSCFSNSQLSDQGSSEAFRPGGRRRRRRSFPRRVFQYVGRRWGIPYCTRTRASQGEVRSWQRGVALKWHRHKCSK